METITTYGVGPDQPTYNQLREQNRVLRLAIEEYAMAKTDFDEKRLQEDHHAWRERYTRLVGAETILIALTATSQEGQHESR